MSKLAWLGYGIHVEILIAKLSLLFCLSGSVPDIHAWTSLLGSLGSSLDGGNGSISDVVEIVQYVNVEHGVAWHHLSRGIVVRSRCYDSEFRRE